MGLVVADTSPIFYLLSIDQIVLLPSLFGNITIPDAVYNELRHPTAPPFLRDWILDRPTWLHVAFVDATQDEILAKLGSGERASIALALSLNAKLILIDERRGTKAALTRGLEAVGTLGILRLAAHRRLINIADCVERLKRTNFRCQQHILDTLLDDVLGNT